MDILTIVGILCGIGAISYVLLEGNMLRILLNMEAIILIYGGTLGSILISYNWSILKWVPRMMLKMIIMPKHLDHSVLINTLVQLAEKAERNGLESLRADLAKVPHPFMADAIRMLFYGLETEVVKERLERDILITKYRQEQLCSVFRSAGTFSPIFGLLGTLIGVVQVLRHITTPESMGASMALAMTASFYGIFSANFIFLPVATKLSIYANEDTLAREIIAKGVLSIYSEKSPWLISKELDAFVSYNLRKGLTRLSVLQVKEGEQMSVE